MDHLHRASFLKLRSPKPKRLVLSLWFELFKFCTMMWFTDYRGIPLGSFDTGSSDVLQTLAGKRRRRRGRATWVRWTPEANATVAGSVEGEFARRCQARACFNNEVVQHPRPLRRAAQRHRHRHRHRHSPPPPCSRNSTAWDGSTITAICRPCSHSCSSDRLTATSRSPARARRCERTR